MGPRRGRPGDVPAQVWQEKCWVWWRPGGSPVSSQVSVELGQGCQVIESRAGTLGVAGVVLDILPTPDILRHVRDQLGQSEARPGGDGTRGGALDVNTGEVGEVVLHVGVVRLLGQVWLGQTESARPEVCGAGEAGADRAVAEHCDSSPSSPG